MSEDYSFSPKTPVRPHTLYVGWHINKGLGLVARKTGISREDLVTIVLSTWLAQEHPEIESWLKQREAEEKEFLSKLKPVPFTEAREKTEKFQATNLHEKEVVP